MQYNPQYFVTGLPNCSKFYPTYQPPPSPSPCNTSYPYIIGEGEITSILLPDGTVQLYFLPKWTYMQNYNLSNCSPYWNSASGVWIIRSISNPLPFIQQQYEYPRPNSNCNSPMALTSSGFQIKFHNDNCTSTTDLIYFCPRLRASNLSSESNSGVQVAALEKSCFEMKHVSSQVCNSPCNCSPDFRGTRTPIYNGRVSFKAPTKDNTCSCGKRCSRISKHVSNMSIDETCSRRSSRKRDYRTTCHCYSSISNMAIEKNKSKRKRRYTSSSEISSNGSTVSINRKYNSEIDKKEKARQKAEKIERKRQERERTLQQKLQKRQTEEKQMRLEKERLKIENKKVRQENADKKQRDDKSSTSQESNYDSCSCSSSLSFASLFMSTSSSENSLERKHHKGSDKTQKQRVRELKILKKESKAKLKNDKKMKLKKQEMEQKRQVKTEPQKRIKLEIQESDKGACNRLSSQSLESFYLPGQEAVDKQKKELRKLEKGHPEQEKQEIKKLDAMQRKQLTRALDGTFLHKSSSDKQKEQLENELNIVAPGSRKQIQNSPSIMSVNDNTTPCKCDGHQLTILRLLDYIPSTKDMSSECTASPTSDKLLESENDQACSDISVTPCDDNTDSRLSFKNTKQIEEKDSIELCTQTYVHKYLK